MKGATAAIAVLAILAMCQLAVQPSKAVTCGQVESHLMPCLDYLAGKKRNPPGACCAGLDAVKQMAQSPTDRKAACHCLKDAATSQHEMKEDIARNLPARCRIDFDIPISRNVDCEKVGSEKTTRMN